MEMRRFEDADGSVWEAFAVDAVVAHGRVGAALAFRAAEGASYAKANSDEVFRSTITFNSGKAAAFALRTLGEKELRRRLDLARSAVGHL